MLCYPTLLTQHPWLCDFIPSLINQKEVTDATDLLQMVISVMLCGCVVVLHKC